MTVASDVVRRRNAALLRGGRGAAFFLVTAAALQALPLLPLTARLAVALVCGVLGVVAPAVGVLAFVLAVSLPLAATDLLVGVLFLVAGLITLQYFGQRGGQAFLIVTLAFVAALVHAEWAIAALAGYLLGASAGATAAVFAAVVVELAGLLLGRQTLGVTATGGHLALIVPAKLSHVANPLSFGWLAPAVSRIGPDALVKTLTSARGATLLVVQPIVWGVAAALAGTFTRRGEAGRPRPLNAAVTGAAAALPVLGVAAASAILHGPLRPDVLVPAAAVSAAGAAVATAIAEYVFTAQPPASKAAPPQASSSGSLRSEDADVDELLRVIADAEEALEERHTVDGFVLITDMKSFARLTEQQGSMTTAKLIQHHRDLLLPIVREAGGKGKSTGGDGLVAAFSSADDALSAAVRMQKALKADNAGKAAERQVQVRIGVAGGDIIVDRAGCPFIGEALNLAARVMGLADGGQVLATHDVVDATAKLPSPVVPHGEFALKNIAAPVAVEEVLWDEGQQPRRPAAQGAA